MSRILQLEEKIIIMKRQKSSSKILTAQCRIEKDKMLFNHLTSLKWSCYVAILFISCSFFISSVTSFTTSFSISCLNNVNLITRQSQQNEGHYKHHHYHPIRRRISPSQHSIHSHLHNSHLPMSLSSSTSFHHIIRQRINVVHRSVHSHNNIYMVMSTLDSETKSSLCATPNTNNHEDNSNSSSSSRSLNENTKSTSSSSFSFKTSSSSTSTTTTNTTIRKSKKKYIRKRPKTQYEKERDLLLKTRQEKYDLIMKNAKKRELSTTNIWDFESLFPAPVWDENTIHRDLYEVVERDAKTGEKVQKQKEVYNNAVSRGNNKSFATTTITTTTTPTATATSMKSNNAMKVSTNPKTNNSNPSKNKNINKAIQPPIYDDTNRKYLNTTQQILIPTNSSKVDRSLTRMVEDRMYGYRRSQTGSFEYDTSLMGDGAVKFRDGIRLGNALKVNADRLNYHAKKEFIHGRLEEAEELYEKAIQIDPRDGRAYLGLSKIAQRRRDFKYAKECLKAGIARSSTKNRNVLSVGVMMQQSNDNGPNPFLLQALGCLEERMGHLAEAENLYIAAVKSRPCHTAAWIALAQLRTRMLRQGPQAGRSCYRSAEVELKRANLPPSSHLYTAWAELEWKAGSTRRARELFQQALQIDPKCSAAWLQLGVMEAEKENWNAAKNCFESVLKFDQRNSRVLQAYAIMESKRPDGDSRQAIDLFERALKVNSRDGGVLQAYALYVANLGDIDAARNLLRKGTEIDKRHAPLWQAWGVLETRYGSPETARYIFQEGIWACAQPSGGQSGGRGCARLWQAWGVLESQQKDYAAARRCFSRALDADNRNVATVTAWTTMEKDLGEYKDARLIFERALKQFSSGSDEKQSLWRAYELMESETGNLQAAQNVYQRAIRDALVTDNLNEKADYIMTSETGAIVSDEESLKNSNEVEVVRWKTKKYNGFGENSVWLNDGLIEGKVPKSIMKKKNK